MSASPDRATVLKRSRLLFSMIAAPRLRTALAARLEGAPDGRQADPIGPRPDWIDDDGAVDVPTVLATKSALEDLLRPEALLDMERIERLPVDPQEREQLCLRILRLVFSRLDPRGAIGEAELNAAIAMATPDVANVRRAGVDLGFLERTPDGSRYHLAPPPQDAPA